MLSPDYLLRVSEGGEAIAETLHDEIIKQIVERIALRLDRGDNYILTARDKWQIEVLQDAGYLREDIEKEIAKQVKLMQEEIAKAMEDAGVKSMEWDDEIYRAAGLSPKPLDESPYLIRLMQRTYEATMGDWINFTRTTADASQQAFIRSCDRAYTMVSSGAMGYEQAYVDAINDIVKDGVEVIYPSGHKDTIETATLRCIRTGVSQATAQIQLSRMDEMGHSLVIVSSHLGARPSHHEWQGKVYHVDFAVPQFLGNAIVGVSKEENTSGYPDFVESTEYGSVTGICGANCRHNFAPYFEGMENPFEHYDSEENRKEYELQQRQRAMERRIRESKRKCMGFKHGVDNASSPEAKAAAEAEYQKQAALLQKRNKAYNDFCEENGLKRKSERITIAKWDRAQAAKARAAARKAEKDRAKNEPT
ncbi:MAG: phage minor capsid protein [Oscillospiraceae bacterium]|nr:phage minor capsid protein [Oscillospiraceae bacterium]